MQPRLQEGLLNANADGDEEGQACPQQQQRQQRRYVSRGAAMAGCFAAGVFVALLIVAVHLQQHGPLNAQPPHVSSSGAESSQAAQRRCESYLGRSFNHEFSLILTADPGDFSGVSEAHYILENLAYRHDAPRDGTVCGGHSTGMLMGQPVLVVTTGIGPAAASLCTLEVVTNCGSLIKEAVYFGTSGWSPQPGGMLNPPACEGVNWRPNVTRTGDVCISPFSVNWVCKKSSWAAQAAGAPNQCSKPEEGAGPADTPLFGECMFYKDNIDANLQLADDLIAVALSSGAARNFPARSVNVTSHEVEYWSAVAEGVGKQLPSLNPNSAPNIWDYSQCMEVDGQFFYSGSPWEFKARDYAAQTLNAALDLLQQDGQANQADIARMDRRRRLPKQVSAADMIAVSAMEGVGVSEALLRYHGLASTRRLIPFTNVRTLSNWMVQPIRQTKPGVWETVREIPEDFVNGYAHAIATGSATILSLYQDRCLRDADANGGNAAGSRRCSFVIDSNSMVSLLLASGKYART